MLKNLLFPTSFLGILNFNLIIKIKIKNNNKSKLHFQLNQARIFFIIMLIYRITLEKLLKKQLVIIIKKQEKKMFKQVIQKI